MIVRHKRTKTSESGYNLIEVLIAMAILSTVMIAIAGLFLMGRKNVYSGKQMTRAVSVGTTIMEDLEPMTLAQVEDSFGLTGAPGSVELRFDGDLVDTFADSFGRFGRASNGDQGDATKDPDGYLASWYAEADEKLANGEVHMILTPIAADGTAVADFADAPIVQVSVYVSWDEQTRSRNIKLDTVKFDRTRPE